MKPLEQNKNRYKLKLQDVQGKQDTIVSLRSQLEDIKSLNLELSTKLAESKRTVQVKEELISMMESKVITFYRAVNIVYDSRKICIFCGNSQCCAALDI